MGILRFTGKKQQRHEVYDLLDRVKANFIEGKYGGATRCLVIIENPDKSPEVQVAYESCGLHLIEAVGMLEIAKQIIAGGGK